MKPNCLALAASCLLPLLSPAQAPSSAQPSAAPTPDPEPLARDFSEAQVISLGKQIYDQDQHSDIAFRLARASGVDFQAEQIRGWIVVRDRAAERIRFVREDKGAYVNAFEVAFVAGATPQFKRLPPDPLSPAEAGQLRARYQAMNGVKIPCSKLYAFLIFDHPQMDAFLIYAIAKPAEQGAIMVGGHYRFAISRDGQRVFAADRLFRSCITMSETAPDFDRPSGIAVNNVASLRPLETQVYLSLLHQMPITVVAPDGIVWKIDGVRIDAIGRR